MYHTFRLLALGFPDLRDYTLHLELFNFWFGEFQHFPFKDDGFNLRPFIELEHIMLVIVPLYLIYRHKIVVFPLNAKFTMASFCLKASYHSIVLSPFALMSGRNLNYLLVPPPGNFVTATYHPTHSASKDPSCTLAYSTESSCTLAVWSSRSSQGIFWSRVHFAYYPQWTCQKKKCNKEPPISLTCNPVCLFYKSQRSPPPFGFLRVQTVSWKKIGSPSRKKRRAQLRI
jgi:hypothetical protein